MAEMIRMSYKDVEFLSNPEVINISLSANISEKPLLNSDSAVNNVSRNAVVISGSGCFWGKAALSAARELKSLQRSSSSGWLFLPDGSCYDAFFSSLTIKEEAQKDCVSYSFSFIENCNHTSAEYDFGFTYAEEGENMFDIAHRCSVKIEKLMQLNNFKTPFCINAGDRVVLK